MMKYRVFLIAANILPVLMLSGCVTSGQLVQQPTVQLSGVEMTRLKLSGQTCRLSFAVSNPNPFPLPINSVRYSVQLSEQRFASGETPGDFSIPAESDGRFDISVDLDILKTAPRLTNVLRGVARESVTYELNGSFLLDMPLVKSVPFFTSGVISIASN